MSLEEAQYAGSNVKYFVELNAYRTVSVIVVGVGLI